MKQDALVFWGVVVLVAFVIYIGWNNETSMKKCKISHSYETCAYALLR